jgi:formylglycine-generating enzyme required for sulfatase activity
MSGRLERNRTRSIIGSGANSVMNRYSTGGLALFVFLGLGSLADAQTAASHEPGEVFHDCPDCEELVVLPPGEFDMGSTEKPSEGPVHHVTIGKAVAIGRREVTFAEWDQCVAAGACKHNPSDQGWGRASRPVINVSWDDTKEFIAWLSQKTGQTYRLPTEAEWEYAARAGTSSPFWWGKDVGVGHAKCEDCGDPLHKTMPGGSFRPNAFGLYDTAGNAAEWVEDCWNPTYKGAPKDGSAWKTGDCTGRVLRGGSFANKATSLRSAWRFKYDEDVRYYANGFRVARDLK